MHSQKAFLTALLVALCSLQSSGLSCTNPVIDCNPKNYFPEGVTLSHTTTAKLTFANTYVDLIVKSAKGVTYSHRLVRCGCSSGIIPADTQVIYVPPLRLYVNDGPTLGILTHSIPQVSRITAVGQPGYIYSTAVRSRFGANDTTDFADIGNREDVNISFINLDAVSRYKDVNLSVPFFANGESDEATPLGRSEWIKIIALMFDSVESGTQNFDEIMRSYGEAKKIAGRAKRRPSVLLNYPVSKICTLPSEKQYITALLRDANVDYVYMNSGGNDTLQLTLDEVVVKFRWARYFIHILPYPPPSSKNMTSLFLQARTPYGLVDANAVAVNKALRSLASVHCANVWRLSKRASSDKDPSANDFFE